MLVVVLDCNIDVNDKVIYTYLVEVFNPYLLVSGKRGNLHGGGI